MITRRNSAFGSLSICAKFRFWSIASKSKWIKSEISKTWWSRDWLKFEISFLVHLDLFKLDQKRNFVSWSLISNRNWGRSKAKRHAYASRNQLLDIHNWIKIGTPGYIRGVASSRDLLLSREMAVKEALPCDRNRFLVGISNLRKFGSFHVFFLIHMRNLLFNRILDQKLIFE